MLFGRGKRWCQTGVVYAIGVSSFSYFVECMDLWQLVSTHYYIGGYTSSQSQQYLFACPYPFFYLVFGDVIVKALPLRSRSCQRVVSGFCWASRLRVTIFGRQTDQSSAGDALDNLQIVLVVQKKALPLQPQKRESLFSQEFQGWKAGDSTTLTYKRSLR